jgi:uncharacterized membrane protein
MTAGNSFDAEPTLFSALLTPHRSLNRTGFLLLMGFIVLISFVAGLVFLSMGAWPVFGFFGLDALAIYWAFKVNFHRAAAYEEIAVTPSAVHVRRVTHLGAVSEWTFNPLWVRLDIEADEEFGVERLSLVSHGRSLGIASFLSPDEKQSFAKALTAALNSAKRGIDRNPVT